jgi:hypothetical protein
VKVHDAKHNPAGVPFKSKRPAPEPIEDCEDGQAITMPPRTGAALSLAELEKQGPVHQIPGHTKTHSLGICSDGSLVLIGKEDGVVSNKAPLFQLKGKFAVGNAAAAIMKDKRNWVEYKLSADSVVWAITPAAPNVAGGPTGSKPTKGKTQQAVMTLNAFLKALEVAGHVKVQLRMHTAERPNPSFSPEALAGVIVCLATVRAMKSA